MSQVALMWSQVSGHPEGDAAYLAALASRGWRDWKRREELRLRLLYSVDHMKAVGQRLRAMGFDLEPYREPVRFFGRNG